MGSRWGDATDSPELNLAGDELVTQLMGYEFAERQAWEARKRHEPKDWFDASFAVQSITWMTAEELAAVSEGIRGLLMRHIERLNDPSARPEGARPVRFIAWGNPAS
jgi:hypothetical protein